MPAQAATPVLVMVLKGYPRLSETFIANEIALLESLGFRVRIVSMRDPREAARHAAIYRIKAPVTYLPDRILPALGELLYENVRAALPGANCGGCGYPGCDGLAAATPARAAPGPAPGPCSSPSSWRCCSP